MTTINLKVSSTTGQELHFTASDVAIKSGKNEIHVTCNTTVPGVYIFEQVTCHWRTLSFKQEFVEAGKKQQLILYPHGNALSTELRMDRESIFCGVEEANLVYLDRPKRICVKVSTGWNDITKGEVMLKSEAEGVTFDLAEAFGQVYSGDNGMSFEMRNSW